MKTDMEDYWKPYGMLECNDSMGDHKKREQRKVLTGTITGSMLVR